MQTIAITLQFTELVQFLMFFAVGSPSQAFFSRFIIIKVLIKKCKKGQENEKNEGDFRR